MKTLSGIMSHTSKEEYLENCRERYPSRNRAGRSAMIDEVSDTLDWDRKHTIKALNRQVTHGKKAKRRGSKPGYGPAEQSVIVAIWKHSEQPCGMRLKQTLPLWVNSGGEVRVGLERIEEDREEEMERAGETHPQRAAAGAENLVKTTPKNQNQAKCRVS